MSVEFIIKCNNYLKVKINSRLNDLNHMKMTSTSRRINQ